LIIAGGSANAQNDYSRVTTGNRGVFHHLYRRPLRNQKMLTPYANVHFRGARGGDGVAASSVAAATASRR